MDGVVLDRACAPDPLCRRDLDGRECVLAELLDAPLTALIPAPNRAPLLLDPGGAPRAVASGIAYCLATGLLGSMWTPGDVVPLADSAVEGTVKIDSTATTTSRREWCRLLRKPSLRTVM